MHARGEKVSRDVTGIVLLDKPAGITSNQALQRVKRLFGAAKAGHTGSLDPLATGMLPICLGEATKVSGLLLDAAKSYRVTAALGAATDTCDADGTVVERRPAPEIEASGIEAALAGFVGEIEQVPPMYSALKHKGRRLYELARRGEEVEREARRVTIYAIELEAVDWPVLEFRVDCSKGTYVRTLVVDLAARLGTVGHVRALRRLAVAPYAQSQMRDIADLEALAAEGWDRLDATLLPPDGALCAWPAIELDVEAALRLRQGQWLASDPARAPGRVRLYGEDGAFLGVGEVLATGELRPRRLFVVGTLGAESQE
jgi:tRNA pseudouridine55 synthase